MRPKQARYFIELMIHAIFWLVIYYALRALTVSSFKMMTSNNGKVSGQMSMSMLFPYSKIVLSFLVVLFYSNAFWLFRRVIQTKGRVISAIIIFAWGALLFAINYWIINQLIGERAVVNSAIHRSQPGPAGGGVSQNDWWQMQPIILIIFVSVLGIAAAYFLIKEWIRNDLKRSQVEAHQLSTEIKFLRSQVNPHFLFNTLNNLFNIAQKKGVEEVADGISKLSGMMRYMIYESNTDVVPLQKEIEYLTDCIALNKLRYADNEVSVSLVYPAQAEIAGIQIAPMLFIPFLENAFKHGVLIGLHSMIALDISVKEKRLIFACTNDDHSRVKKLVEENGGIGLENVKRRLELLYPQKHDLKTHTENGKFKVTLQIDLV